MCGSRAPCRGRVLREWVGVWTGAIYITSRCEPGSLLGAQCNLPTNKRHSLPSPPSPPLLTPGPLPLLSIVTLRSRAPTRPRSEYARGKTRCWWRLWSSARHTRALFNQARALSSQTRALSNYTRALFNHTRALSNQTRALSDQTRAFYPLNVSNNGFARGCAL